MEKQLFMQACRDGGAAIEQALRTLDSAFFAVLYRESLRTLKSADDAKDVVQDTFIKVWQRCATYHGDSELLPWIRAILRRSMIDRLRRPGRETATSDEDLLAMVDMHSSTHGPTPSQMAGVPHLAARQRELDACFVRCWQEFETHAPAHAAVMTWIVHDGLTPHEISELLGRTPGATREFISQCRKRARAYLAEWYQLAFVEENHESG